jgi:hypothetical protein
MDSCCPDERVCNLSVVFDVCYNIYKKEIESFFNCEGRNKRGSTHREMDMKKAICLVLAVLVLLFASALHEYAYGQQSHHGGGGHHGGHHGGGSHFSGSIWIGPGWGGWGPWWWGAPYYPYYSYYPYYPYYSPPVVIQQQPPIYVEPTPQPEEQSYWYYCPNPQGYYPYVKRCPKGWMKVVPSPVAPDGEE